MIKRPFVFLFLAFVFGCVLTKCSVTVAILSISLAMGSILLILFAFRVPNRYVNRLDQFLLLLPILMFLGFVLMSRQQAENPMSLEFDQKAKGSATGTIERIVQKGENTTLYLKNSTIQLSKNSRSYPSKKIIIYTKKTEAYKIGNVIQVYGEVRKFSPATNPGQFDEALYYRINGIDYKIYETSTTLLSDRVQMLPQTLYSIRIRLVQAYTKILDEKNAGTVSAMLLGDKSMLEQETKDLYQENGITHILAISGFHVALIGLGVYKLLCMTGCGMIPASFIGMFFVYCYGLLTDFSVSTSRAVMMLVVFLFGNVIGKTYDMISATACSALLILLFCPMELFDPGFLLSYGAILAIAYLVPIGKQMAQAHAPDWYENKSVRLVYESILVCGCIQLVTTPLLLYYFYEFPPYSIIVNLLILPPMALLTWLTIVGGICGVLSEVIGRFLIGGAYYILELYEGICRIFAGIPGHMLIIGRPSLVQIFMYYFILVIFIVRARKNESRRNLLLLLLLFILFLRPDMKEMSVTFLDVSQGDCIVIQIPGHHTYLVDGGSSDVSKVGMYRIIPYLKSQGIQRIDAVFLTHADADHTNGIEELLAGGDILVSNLVLPDIAEYQEEFADLIALAKEGGVKVKTIAKGEAVQNGTMELHCLAPESGYEAESSNGNSMVLCLSYHECTFLLAGDLEGEEEQRLLETNNKVRTRTGELCLEDVDVLKVAHHGSKNSSTEKFLAAVSPDIAVISAGKGNRYGHPHMETLDRIEQEGSMVLSTILCGAITCKCDGIHVKVYSAKY